MTQIIDGVKLDFDDVLIRPMRSETASRSDVELKRVFTFKHTQHTHECIPIIAANMSCTGTPAMFHALAQHRMMTAISKHYTQDELMSCMGVTDWLDAFFTIGIRDGDESKLCDFADRLGRDPVFLCIDVANGYSARFVQNVSWYREKYPSTTIMAGNVCTPEMTQELILAGADIVKIGIGPGSACTTRKKTGVGYPQLHAVVDCANVAHGLSGHICADGGCRTEGDICKCFGAGADFVMLGGMLAGTEECDGDWKKEYECQSYIAPDGSGIWVDRPKLPTGKTKKVYLKFMGMSSYAAQDQFNGGAPEYAAEEGEVIEIPYKGPVEAVLKEICGSLRSYCAYIGATKLKDAPKCTNFVRIR